MQISPTPSFSRPGKHRIFQFAALTIIFALCLVVFLGAWLVPSSTASAGSSNSLSTHYVPGYGYRDELNASDIDYNNFWTDNAGKILTMAALTGDQLDASRALSFLEGQGLSSSTFYLPEVLVNSSLSESQASSGESTVSNRMILLQGNSTANLKGLALGNYYSGETILGYLGSDRILVNGTIYRSASSEVFMIPNGYVKRSLFVTGANQDFYVFLNATITTGEPYANLSIQVLPLNSSIIPSDYLYLQVFSSSGQFDNASLYSTSGGFVRNLSYDNGSPSAKSGAIVAYSRQDSVFNEDGVALSFGQSNGSQIEDFEHWYRDGPFDGLSWIGMAYSAPDTAVGSLSPPIFSKVYPINHLDYRLLNDTMKYMMESQRPNEIISPPVGFGFVAYGLALESSLNPQNSTLDNLARGYWNYYYSRYNDTTDYSSAYARSTNLLALAGLKLYGCNSTVESFAERFLTNNPGSSIEEYGWAAAASYQLKSCNGDSALYQSFVDSFMPSSTNFVMLPPNRSGVVPSYTFQYGETASGLLLGGVPFNNSAVLEAMDVVYQSNVSGTVLNQPFHGDLANTETLPAYLLSTYLFQGEMRNTTGFWISGLSNVNVTAVQYSNGELFILAVGRNGTLLISNSSGLADDYTVNGEQIFEVPNPEMSNSTTFVTRTSTSTLTTIFTYTPAITDTSTVTSTLTSVSTLTTTVTTTTSATANPVWQLYVIILTIVVIIGSAGTSLLLVRVKRRA